MCEKSREPNVYKYKYTYYIIIKNIHSPLLVPTDCNVYKYIYNTQIY